MQCLDHVKVGILEAWVKEPRKRAGIPRGLSHKKDRGARRKFKKKNKKKNDEVPRSCFVGVAGNIFKA